MNGIFTIRKNNGVGGGHFQNVEETDPKGENFSEVVGAPTEGDAEVGNGRRVVGVDGAASPGGARIRGGRSVCETGGGARGKRGNGGAVGVVRGG